MAICKLGHSEIAYDDRGTGPALVLLHGFPLDRRVWEDAAAVLEKKFRVITPDLPGFGESKSDQAFTIASLADGVQEMLVAIGVGSCVLGGLSMGGYAALALAKKYATFLDGLILIDTKAAADTPQAKLGREQMIELVRQHGSRAIADQMFPKMIAASGVNTAAAARLRSMMDACPAPTIERALAAMRDREDYLGLLSKLTMPTLIVVGAEDAIAPPEIAKAMHEAALRSQLAIVRGAGHMTPIEQPRAFAEVIIAAFGQFKP